MALLAVTQYPLEPAATPSGDFLLDPLVTFDSAFHVGLTRELVVGHPPQVPGRRRIPARLSPRNRPRARRRPALGRDRSLGLADAPRRHPLGPRPSSSACAPLAARLGGSPAAVALAPWTLLLTDFSFVFAANPQAHWWTDLLRGNLLLSLVYANPRRARPRPRSSAPSSRSSRFEERRAARRTWPSPPLLAAAVPFFKVFLGAHLLLGLGRRLRPRAAARRARALVARRPPLCPRHRRPRPRPGRRDGAASSWRRSTSSRVTRETLGLAPLAGPALRGLGGALARRVAGPAARRRSRDAVRAPARPRAAASALAAMALSGWPLGLLFRVSAPEVLAGQKFVNDAAYLVEQSGPLLWLFAAVALARLATTAARRRAAALAAACSWPRRRPSSTR